MDMEVRLPAFSLQAINLKSIRGRVLRQRGVAWISKRERYIRTQNQTAAQRGAKSAPTWHLAQSAQRSNGTPSAGIGFARLRPKSGVRVHNEDAPPRLTETRACPTTPS